MRLATSDQRLATSGQRQATCHQRPGTCRPATSDQREADQRPTSTTLCLVGRKLARVHAGSQRRRTVCNDSGSTFWARPRPTINMQRLWLVVALCVRGSLLGRYLISSFVSSLRTSSCRCGVDLGFPTWPSDPANYQLSCHKTVIFENSPF